MKPKNFFIFINALEEFSSYTDRALTRYDSSTGNDVTSSSRKTQAQVQTCCCLEPMAGLQSKIYGIKAWLNNNFRVLTLQNWLNPFSSTISVCWRNCKGDRCDKQPALLKYYRVYRSLKFIKAWFHVVWQNRASTSTIFLQYEIWTLKSTLFLMVAVGTKQFGITFFFQLLNKNLPGLLYYSWRVFSWCILFQ